MDYKFIGRKWSQVIGFWLAAIMIGISTIFAEMDTSYSEIGTTIPAFLGKFMIGGVYVVIYVHTAELYPTMLRTIGVGTGNMASYIFNMIVPFILTLRFLASWLPGLVFCTSAVFGGLLMLILKETLNTPSLQTIQDAVEFYKKK